VAKRIRAAQRPPEADCEAKGALAEVPASAAAKVAAAKAAHVTAAKAAAPEMTSAEAAHVAEIAAGEVGGSAAELTAVAGVAIGITAAITPAVAEAVTGIPIAEAVVVRPVTVAVVVTGSIAIAAAVVAACQARPKCAANHSSRDSGAGIVAITVVAITVSVATSVSPSVMVMGDVAAGDVPVHAVCHPRVRNVLIIMSNRRRACNRQRRGQDKSGCTKRESRNSKSPKCHGDIPFSLATERRRRKTPPFHFR
jgi:hypothetical protein